MAQAFNTSTGKQSQADLCGFEASLVPVLLSEFQDSQGSVTQRDPVSKKKKKSVGEMTQWFKVLVSKPLRRPRLLRRPRFNSQHPYWAAHNCLKLHFQGM